MGRHERLELVRKGRNDWADRLLGEEKSKPPTEGKNHQLTRERAEGKNDCLSRE